MKSNIFYASDECFSHPALVRAQCHYLRITILTKVRISSIIKKMHCHSGESQNLQGWCPARTISSPLIAAVAYLLFSVFIFIFKGPQAASRFP
ncbi:hypothetical protein [Daejeonella sp. H1SJ63]|uniref:hypothetical protein n=1 Tax=Daejeonella sp. H1SJ63 TaxID=3034145 RepID=UPI0023EAABF4|nr:hypothetical protein [Daejeonella sp. H1SJ63]